MAQPPVTPLAPAANAIPAAGQDLAAVESLAKAYKVMRAELG